MEKQKKRDDEISTQKLVRDEKKRLKALEEGTRKTALLEERAKITQLEGRARHQNHISITRILSENVVTDKDNRSSSSSSDLSSGVLSDYEKIRQVNIKRNEEFLKSLGFGPAAAALVKQPRVAKLLQTQTTRSHTMITRKTCRHEEEEDVEKDKQNNDDDDDDDDDDDESEGV